MKKQLLLTMAAMLGATSSFAQYKAGDVVHSNTGAAVITGENLVVNGDFSDGVNGWTNVCNNALNNGADTLVVETGDTELGADKHYIRVAIAPGSQMSTNYCGSANFRQGVQLQEGKTYVVTYKARLLSDGVSSNTRYSRNDNYQDVYLNWNGKSDYKDAAAAGDESKVLGSMAEYTQFQAGKWQTVNYIYRADSAVYANFEFFNLALNDRYADFGIYEAQECADSRHLDDAIAFVESICADETNFPGAKEYFAELLASLKEMNTPEALSQMMPEDLQSTISDMLGTAEGTAMSEYLASISADVSTYFSESNFTLDEAGTTSADRDVPDWTEVGGRWGVRAPWQNVWTNHIFAESPANSAMGAGSEWISANLPKGKYLFIVQGSATQYYADGSGKNSNYYVADYYHQNMTMKYFVNGDSITMEDVPNKYAKTYWNVFEVAEDGEQTIGFYRQGLPAYSGPGRGQTSGSGIVRFNPMFIRILGATQKDVEAYFLAQTLAASQNALQVMIDSAQTVVDDKYAKRIYGKQTLNDSIGVSKKIMEQYKEATQECIDILDQQMVYMRDAIRACYALNESYVKLADDIASAKALTTDETRPAGRDALNQAITAAQGVYDARTAAEVLSVADSTALADADKAILAAIQEFYYANTSFKSPAEIQIVNADFADNATGWTTDPTGGNGVWKFGTVDTGTSTGSVRAMYYNRGYTAGDIKWVYQDVPITKTGAYEFFATLAVHNSEWNSLEFDSHTYLYINTDSIKVITKGDGSKKQQIGEWGIFSEVTNVESLDAVPETTIPAGYVRIGLEERDDYTDGRHPNIIYFAAPKLLFYGDWEDYLTGIYDVENVETNAKFDVYNLNGMKVRSGATSLDGLAKGIYIVNGKKYVVK